MFLTVTLSVSPLLTVIVEGEKEKELASTLNSLTFVGLVFVASSSIIISSTPLPGTGILVLISTSVGAIVGAIPLFLNNRKPPATKTTTITTAIILLFIPLEVTSYKYTL